MNNNQPPYSLVHSGKPMTLVPIITFGLFKEVFQDRTFGGELERIVIEFSTKRLDPAPGTRLVSNPEPQMQGLDYMPIIYTAFGRPKKFLAWRTKNLIARISMNMGPQIFGRPMLPQQLVDFAVSEAASLARTYGLQVEIIYHGDPFYARKYLQQLQQPQQQQLPQ